MNDWRLKEIRELAVLTGMEQNPLIKKVLASPVLQARPGLIEKITRLLHVQMAVKVPEPHPFLPAPAPDDAVAHGLWVSPGRVIGGNGIGHEFHDPLHSFLQHKGVFGPAGSGKTMLSLHMTLQAHRQGIPVWWFDTEDELAPLLAHEPGILFVEMKDLRFNPFDPPPGCDPEDYIHKATTRLRELAYFRDRSVNLAREVCQELYREQGAFSIGDVYRRVAARSGRAQSQAWREARATCCDRFGEMLSAWGPTINVRRGHDIARLLERSVVWRLRNLSDDHAAFLSSYLLLWVENYRAVQYAFTLDNIFGFDEVTRITNASRERRADMSEPFFHDFARTCRKRGIGLVLATQTPGLLPLPLLANLSSWYTFRPVDSMSARVLSNSMALTREHMDYFLNLPKDKGRVVAVRHPIHPQPFLVQVAEVGVRAGSAEAIARAVEKTRQWLGPVPGEEERRPVVLQGSSGNAAKPRRDAQAAGAGATGATRSTGSGTGQTAEPAAKRKAVVARAPGAGSAEAPQSGARPAGSDAQRQGHEVRQEGRQDRDRGQARGARARALPKKEHLDYVESIAKEPFIPSTRRDQQLGLSGCKGNRIRKELGKLGLTRPHTVNTGIRGKQYLLLELTDEAYALLDAVQVKAHRTPGNGSFLHRFMQDAVCRWASGQGLPARIEEEVGGKRVDVGVQRAGPREAFEVVVEGLEKELSNLKKDFQAGYAKVTFVAERQETLDRLEQMVRDQYGERGAQAPEAAGQGRVGFARLREFVE